MEGQDPNSYYISEDDFNKAKDANAMVRIVTRFNNTPPAGNEVVLLDAQGNLVRVLCPRPCPTSSSAPV
jgi:hypothetical protein